MWPSESPSTHQDSSVAKAHFLPIISPGPDPRQPRQNCLSDRCRGCSCCFSWRRRRPVSTTADTRTSASTPKHTHTLTRTHTHTHTHTRARTQLARDRLPQRQTAPATGKRSSAMGRLPAPVPERQPRPWPSPYSLSLSLHLTRDRQPQRQTAPATDCPSDKRTQLGNASPACAGPRASAPALASSYRWLPKLFVAEKLHNRLHACRGRHDRSKGLPGVFTKMP